MQRKLPPKGPNLIPPPPKLVDFPPPSKTSMSNQKPPKNQYQILTRVHSTRGVFLLTQEALAEFQHVT